MAIQTPATTKMVQNVIDGTTPVKNMMSTNTDQTITGQKTFDNGKLLVKDDEGNTFVPVAYYTVSTFNCNDLPKKTGYFYNEDGFQINVPRGSQPTTIYQVITDLTANGGYQYTGGSIFPLYVRTFDDSDFTDWSQVFYRGKSYADLIGSSTVGSATQPVYINNGEPSPGIYTLGAACQKSLSDSSTASALSSTDTNVPTVRDIYYGTPTINGSKAYTSSTSIYAPTTGGTPGAVLVANGTGAPGWESDYLSTRTSLYSSTSLSTGNKTLSQSVNNFSIIFFSLESESNGEHYPFWVPKSEFQGRNLSSNKLSLASNDYDKNRYVNFYYVNATTFYITSFSGIRGIQIWGIA